MNVCTFWVKWFLRHLQKHTMKKIDDEYRKTDEYKTWMAIALERFPNLNQSMFDMALAAHFGNPKAYRDKKKFPHNPTPTPTDLTLNTVTVEPPEEESSIRISEVEHDDHPPMGHAVVCEEVSVAVTDADCDTSLA